MTIITLHYLFFWSLCESVGDFFGPRYFSEGAAPSEIYLGPKQSSPISNNDFKTDGAQLHLYYCLTDSAKKKYTAIIFLNSLIIKHVLYHSYQNNYKQTCDVSKTFP